MPIAFSLLGGPGPDGLGYTMIKPQGCEDAQKYKPVAFLKSQIWTLFQLGDYYSSDIWTICERCIILNKRMIQVWSLAAVRLPTPHYSQKMNYHRNNLLTFSRFHLLQFDTSQTSVKLMEASRQLMGLFHRAGHTLAFHHLILFSFTILITSKPHKDGCGSPALPLWHVFCYRTHAEQHAS